MTVWIACGADIIAADVIRWREPIWERRGPKGAKPRKVGDREVVAEVIDGPDADGWMILLVRGCTLLTDSRPEDQLKTGQEMRRKATTITRGEAARLEWTDEAARRAVRGSRFIRPTHGSGSSPDARDV